MLSGLIVSALASWPAMAKGRDKDPELVALGERLRALRGERGMTQEELAQASELHWTYIGQIERGERNLTYKNLLRLARGLDVVPGRLIADRN
jgi:transcriptional regulator with XRE-family HTH domain